MFLLLLHIFYRRVPVPTYDVHTKAFWIFTSDWLVADYLLTSMGDVLDTERKLLELSSRMQGLPLHPPEILEEREQLWSRFIAKASAIRYLYSVLDPIQS